jgi:hypothetical protein
MVWRSEVLQLFTELPGIYEKQFGIIAGAPKHKKLTGFPAGRIHLM